MSDPNEQKKYPIIEELAPATEEDFAYWETEEAWVVEQEGYDILGFPLPPKTDEENPEAE